MFYGSDVRQRVSRDVNKSLALFRDLQKEKQWTVIRKRHPPFSSCRVVMDANAISKSKEFQLVSNL